MLVADPGEDNYGWLQYLTLSIYQIIETLLSIKISNLKDLTLIIRRKFKWQKKHFLETFLQSKFKILKAQVKKCNLSLCDKRSLFL